MLGETAFHRTTRVITLAGLALMVISGACTADPKDYRFELMDKTVKVGTGAVIRIRVVNISTKKAVDDAEVRVNALDMSPDGMAEMNAKATPVVSNEAQVHAFTANLTMAGRWSLSVEAKIPGDSAPIRDRLLVRAWR
jgi:hypothetical protein